MGKVIKLFTILFSIVLIASAFFVAMLAFPIFGNQALIVRSGSMEPTIGVGSVVVVRQSNTSTYQEGDVISFRYDKDTIITHRIFEVIKSPNGNISYKTKGDANEEEDNWVVASEDILGRNYFTIPEFGKLLAFARSKYGFPLLIIFPSSLVILLEIVSIIKEVKKGKKKKELIHPLVFPKDNAVDYQTVFTKKNFGLLKVLLPFVVFAFFIQSTSAFFSDTETSSNNYFQAATTFGTPTPTPSVPVTPTPTNTPTPTPTPGGGCGSSIIISGNGAWSINKAYIKCILENSVTQTNNTNVNTNVETNSDTGENSSNGNDGGDNNTESGNASNTVEVTVEGSVNEN